MTMTSPRITFDTLDFVKRLEAAGEKTAIAEVQAQLQVELQAQILEKQELSQQQFMNKFTEYQPLLEEIKASKDEFATKSDILMLDKKIDSNILRLENRIDKLEIKLDNKIDSLRNDLLVKLGSIVVASTTGLGVVMALICRT